jgi:hypothetical protein
VKKETQLQRIPLEIREVLNTTYRKVDVHPAIVKAVGERIAVEFLIEFNKRDEERKFRQTEVLFYELGCDYLNPILNMINNRPAECNSFLELLLECLEERMHKGGISIAHKYRTKLGRGSWSKTDLTYDYDSEKYPYI